MWWWLGLVVMLGLAVLCACAIAKLDAILTQSACLSVTPQLQTRREHGTWWLVVDSRAASRVQPV